MSKQNEKRSLKRIKSSFWERGLSISKVAVKSSASLAANQVKRLWQDEASREHGLQVMLETQAKWLSEELGKLKGSLMKIGQMLALYGEHFFPEEVVKVLKTLNEESPPLDWPGIEPILNRRLKAELRDQLEIDTHALAAASMGQVHKATIRATGELVCLKIQYPGVAKAIDNDLRSMRSLLAMMRLVPSHKQGFDDMMREVKSMLKQEVDYVREQQATELMRQRTAKHASIVVPKTFPEFSGPKILVSSFESGFNIDSPQVQALSQVRRNRLGEIYAAHFLEELFDFQVVQTDPHFGNYKIRIGEAPDGSEDKLILLDFGAIRKFSNDFISRYKLLMRGALLGDDDLTIRGAVEVGFLYPEDGPALQECFVKLAYAAIEPWLGKDDPRRLHRLFDENDHYMWGESDLPERMSQLGKQYAFTFKLRPPPREVLFLDRKIGGVFIVLNKLKARFDGWAMVEHLANQA